jgi:Zn-dependent alcohol dehydrogenase
MKALIVNAFGRGFDFEDVDIATPIGREVLVDVHASGLCHTDLLFATQDFVPTPAVLGYEVAGIIAAVATDVSQIRVGDHVVGSLAQACGACARCVSGRPTLPRQCGGTRRRDRAEYHERDSGAEARPRRDFRLNECQARHPNVRRAVPARPDEPRRPGFKKISLREVNDGYAALKDGSLTRVVVTSF